MLSSDIRHAVLLPPCVLSPGFQAERKFEVHWGYPFVELLMRHGVNPIFLPCPESSFGGYDKGLRRGKHGIDYYKGAEGYESYCVRLAEQWVEMILDLQAGGFDFICVLGVEHSPTCAVSYMYSHKGMLKRAGMFHEALLRELDGNGMKIPWIGINRTHPQKALKALEMRLSGRA